jgi:hypothetical protein
MIGSHPKGAFTWEYSLAASTHGAAHSSHLYSLDHASAAFCKHLGSVLFNDAFSLFCFF